MNTEATSSTAHMLILSELCDIRSFRLVNENDVAEERKRRRRPLFEAKNSGSKLSGQLQLCAVDWELDCMPHQLRQQEGET
jgi:hypothetical protein